MKNLLYKEFRLALHPTAFIFIGLSALMLVPSYPYYVTYFYTTLAIFFTCLSGRENHDIYYSMSMPVRKRDIVLSRILLASVLELAQLVISVPFALLRQSFTDVPGNEVGMDANIAMFGISFVLLGIFNLIFFTKFYKNPDKVGVTFGISSTVMFLGIVVAETCAHVVPFMRDKLDTPDTVYIPEKLAVLVVGVVIFAVLTIIAYKKSARSFEKIDL